jgi:phosphatidylinositol alpha-mannosyltransferase
MRLALTHVFSWPDVVRGAERYLHEMARAQARRGHDVTIITTGNRPGRRREDGVDVLRLPRRFPGQGVIEEAGFGRQVLPSLLRSRFDAVHSLGPSDASASVLAARVRRRRRTVYTNQGIPFRASWDTRPDAHHHARVVRDVDVYGCYSRHAAEVLRLEYGREGTITPGGVDTSVFVPGRRAPEPTILFSGALDVPRKGLRELLDAFAVVARERPATRLCLTGPGDASALLDAAPPEVRDRTTVLPPATGSELARRYAAAWVTAFPSVKEAFGMVIVESLAAGTPVVGVDDSAVPELVTAEVGTLARPRDTVSLAEGCLSVLDLATRPETAASCRAAALPYDWDAALAPRMEEIYAG